MDEVFFWWIMSFVAVYVCIGLVRDRREKAAMRDMKKRIDEMLENTRKTIDWLKNQK